MGEKSQKGGTYLIKNSAVLMGTTVVWVRGQLLDVTPYLDPAQNVPIRRMQRYSSKCIAKREEKPLRS